MLLLIRRIIATVVNGCSIIKHFFIAHMGKIIVLDVINIESRNII